MLLQILIDEIICLGNRRAAFFVRNPGVGSLARPKIGQRQLSGAPGSFHEGGDKALPMRDRNQSHLPEMRTGSPAYPAAVRETSISKACRLSPFSDSRPERRCKNIDENWFTLDSPKNLAIWIRSLPKLVFS